MFSRNCKYWPRDQTSRNCCQHSNGSRKSSPRFFDVRADIRDFNLVVIFARVFAESNYDSDVFWEFVTETIAASFGSLPWSQKADIMKSFSRAKRGSDELWEYFLKQSLLDQSVDTIERDINLVACISEVELPGTMVPSTTLNTASLASSITKAKNSGHIVKANSVTCENLAYLAVQHPWTTGEEAHTFENILKDNLSYAMPTTITRIGAIYDRAKQSGSLKTEGVEKIIEERTFKI